MVPEDVVGCCHDWGVNGVEFFRTPEVEGCVVPWEVNGCLVAGGISHDASVDAKIVFWWRCLFSHLVTLLLE